MIAPRYYPFDRISLKKATIRNRVYVPTEYGQTEFCSFESLIDNKEHIAIIFNQADNEANPLVRIHSECLTGDLFQSKRCDCGDQLQESLQCFSKKSGILLYLRQEGRGIGLYNKLRTYELQLQGCDTYEANRKINFSEDLRNYDIAAQMLFALRINHIQLITNNPDKEAQIKNYGICVTRRINTRCYVKHENKSYLLTKLKQSNHELTALRTEL